MRLHSALSSTALPLPDSKPISACATLLRLPFSPQGGANLENCH